MFLGDDKALDYLTLTGLLFLPIAATAWGLWGWLMEVLLLIAVFRVGKQRGPLFTGILLTCGYGFALLVFRWQGIEQMGFVPFAALLTIAGWQRLWPERVVFFWGLLLAGLLGAVPTVGYVFHSLQPQSLQGMVDSAWQMYQRSGLIAMFQQQGITEAQLRGLFQQLLPTYVLLVPGLAAVASFIEFGLVSIIAGRWFGNGAGHQVPFARWRLPWYAVWGAILALASYLLGDQFAWPVLRGFGINLMVVYAAFTFMIGVSIYIYFLQSPRVPRILKWILIIINLFNFLFSVVSLVLCGLFDLVLNFRRLPDSDAGRMPSE